MEMPTSLGEALRQAAMDELVRRHRGEFEAIVAGLLEELRAEAEHAMRRDPTPSIREVVEVVARAAHLRMDDLLGPSRRRPLVKARHVAMFLARERVPGASFPDIALVFERDHTTIINAVQAVERRVAEGDDRTIELLGRARRGLDRRLTLAVTEAAA